MLKKLVLILISLWAFQVASAQSRTFATPEFYDDFDDGSFENWKVSNNADNLYFLENGHYEMYRRNKQTVDMVFCKWENPLNNFEIRLNLKFEKSKNKNQYAGVVFKATKSTALVAEIHQEGKVRIRKISDGKVTYLTSTPNEQGWVKFKSMGAANNLLTIQCDSNNYTLLVNGTAILTKQIDSFSVGRVGLVIGADTKIWADNFGVYSETKMEAEPEPIIDTPVETMPVYKPASKDTTKVAKGPKTNKQDSTARVVVPKPNIPTNVKPATNAEIVALKKKNDELQLQLNQYRNKANQEQDRADSLQSILDHDGKRDYRNENYRLEAENKALQRQNDSLMGLVRAYEDVRVILNKSEGSEISLKLAEKLRMEKMTNEALEKRNKELELQNKKLTLRVKKLESK